MIALAVALVGAGILASAALYQRADHQVPVIMVIAPVPAGLGGHLGRPGHDHHRGRPGPAGCPGQAAEPGDRPGRRGHAAAGHAAGARRADHPLAPAKGQVLVSLPLKPQSLPASGLAPGDHVLVTGTPGYQGQAGVQRLSGRPHPAGARRGRGGQYRPRPGRLRRGRSPGRAECRDAAGAAGLDRPDRADRDQPEFPVSLYALVSAGGSPGVTTSALALTLSWPSQVILAECDPSGGDVLAGLFAGHLAGDQGPGAAGAHRGPEHRRGQRGPVAPAHRAGR